MKLALHTTLIAGVVALGFAVYVYFTPGPHRIGPGTLLLIALLLFVRYAVQRQALKRREILKEVPKHPLGLDESAKPEDSAK